MRPRIISRILDASRPRHCLFWSRIIAASSLTLGVTRWLRYWLAIRVCICIFHMQDRRTCPTQPPTQSPVQAGPSAYVSPLPHISRAPHLVHLENCGAKQSTHHKDTRRGERQRLSRERDRTQEPAGNSIAPGARHCTAHLVDMFASHCALATCGNLEKQGKTHTSGLHIYYDAPRPNYRLLRR